MNYNLITYGIYIALMSIVIYKIGKVCYKNGKVFILNVLCDEELTNSINKTLLAGYYLVNIGFVIYTIKEWPQIDRPLEIINELAKYVGSLMILLASLHYFNIYFITHLLKKLIKF